MAAEIVQHIPDSLIVVTPPPGRTLAHQRFLSVGTVGAGEGGHYRIVGGVQGKQQYPGKPLGLLLNIIQKGNQRPHIHCASNGGVAACSSCCLSQPGAGGPLSTDVQLHCKILLCIKSCKAL